MFLGKAVKYQSRNLGNFFENSEFGGRKSIRTSPPEDAKSRRPAVPFQGKPISGRRIKVFPLSAERRIFIYTEKKFCIYEKIFLHIQKFIYVRTEKKVSWHGEKFLWAWKKNFYGHGIFTPCRRRFFCISFRQKFLLFLRRVSRAFALPCLQNIVPVRCPVSGCPMPDLLYFVATTVLLSEIYCVILCPNRIVQMPAGMGKTTQDSNAERT